MSPTPEEIRNKVSSRKNGHGRASTFLASCFIYKYRILADEALKKVFEKRQSGHLDEVQNEFLVNYARRSK